MSRELLTVKDLAVRWNVSERQARETVLSGGIPMIELRATARNVSWATTRFDTADVESWEAGRKRVQTAPESAPAPKVKPLGGRPLVPNRLDRW
ncbi:hypothetical protein [Planctomyces sp. SH-PL62]|uniref:hypothetical protein n=1 Tax=Planctomyces sp. SH-PL62 TaxID=1636152 RepID=UPI00078B3A1F|nr:hypothetical protein [Planctomyces sp. SH-PL62]AMV37410.1 hypothetical protein VT85_08245 [Planctomyces sp. SH-PL62]